MSSSSLELDKVENEIILTHKEFFLDTAVGPGLEALEHRLGIVIDKSKPLDQRRSLIKARIKSKQKIGLSSINNICQAWVNGSVDANVIGSKIIVKFISVGGIPSGLDDLQDTLKKIIPTHLDIDWEFTYLTWDMYETHDMNWDEWEALNLSWDELEIYI